ncbi:MAG TPA: N-acetylmuramoyl-L-alanine amidase, partial [Gemmatimonadaceae bacterium]|nr:N-acetylmuramoyl-L-alanine amidase [Gemmatimonadaceae bacterium]
VDSARVSHPVKIAVPPAVPPRVDSIVPMTVERYAMLMGPASYASNTDRVVTGYAPEGGVERWFLLPGTVVRVTGTRGTDIYAMLDSTQTVRIEQAEYKMLDSGVVAPQPRASAVTLKHSPGWTDVIIPITQRPAYLVTESASSLTLTLYGTTGPKRQQRSLKGPASSYVSVVTPKANGPQMQYVIDLKGAIYGYQPLWEEGKLTFRIRRPARVDPASPLMGLTIAVDPGHPPVGATGPTGLWEPVPTLDVGFKVRELLQAKGVNVLMTRTTADPVDLNLRPTMARRADAHALVSIHLNAVPDGVNPFRAQGTETYHYHPHSGPLALAVQQTAVANMGLRDNGAKRRNLALVRPTWMPSVLVEGAFIMMPDQEAAMRTPEYQERYAKGIVEGLENYFRSLAAVQR